MWADKKWRDKSGRHHVLNIAEKNERPTLDERTDCVRRVMRKSDLSDFEFIIEYESGKMQKMGANRREIK